MKGLSTVKITRLYDYQTWPTPLFEKFTKRAKVCGLLFLDCAFRAMTGWAGKPRSHGKHSLQPTWCRLPLSAYPHSHQCKVWVCEAASDPLLTCLIWWTWKTTAKRAAGESFTQTVAHTSHSQTKGSLNCPHIILPKQGHPITWKKISVLVILHYNDYEILISESTSVGPRRQNTAFYQLKLIQI